MRRRRVTATLITLALGTLVLGACSAAPGPSLRRVGARTEVVVRADGQAVPGAITEAATRAGFNPGSGILWMDDAERRRELDAMAATGAKWIALDFDWNSIQGDGPNSFRWDRSTDTVVRQAHERGLNIIGTLAYSPPWARRAACANTSHCFPNDMGAFARFAEASARRYGTNALDPTLRNTVRVWQIWNEPNHYPFVQPTVDVAGYTTMLRNAYVSLKRADPGSTVLAGATSPAADEANGRNMSPMSFLLGIYEHGGGGFFDALSHHPYTFPYSPVDEAPWNAFTQTRTLHDIMTVHGDGAKKIWATESGAGTGTNTKAVSAARQAQILRDYFTLWNGGYRDFTGPLLWFSVRDAGTDPASIYDNFGILAHDFSPKPARDVLVALLRN
jgi:hypothetical protein